MPLIDDVKAVCDRLAGFGWRNLILKVTDNALDISQTSSTKLKNALAATLTTVDRTVAGFADFHPSGNQGVTAGKPARSLLYHALASPFVHPTTDGSPDAVPSHYPSLAELDTVENYIYSLVSDINTTGLVVAVFAYHYREGNRTSHQRYADMTYSRTGVARIGTANENYDTARRSFWVIPRAGGDEIAVLPARYGVFLAKRGGSSAGTVQGGDSAAGASYLFPVHKLFVGKECLDGKTLAIEYLEFHRNEKLRKTHRVPLSSGGLPLPAGFDINKPPYVRDSINSTSMVALKPAGSSILLVPKPASRLVSTAAQRNSVSGTNQLVHFVVPAEQSIGGRGTRFAASTLEIPAAGADRLAPEYVNIRQRINPAGPVTQTPVDLNTLSATQFATAMTDGGYPAAHFVDESCDGCVEALLTGFDADEKLPAFSLVTAPDFFPLADQWEVQSDPSIGRVEPLSRGRLPVNPTLPRPGNPSQFAFDRTDTTITAVVGDVAAGPILPKIGLPNRSISYLPDAASNVFAPGWDTSRSRDAMGVFLTSSGLGSPFPEDAKLCAALASFWPAVAPDNGRTFGNEGGFGNQLPMLDDELGYHPDHELVVSGAKPSFTGWDGEYGPFFERVGSRLHVNYVAIERSDYVSNSLAGTVRVSLTATVQSEDLIARHQALNRCEAIPGFPDDMCLVVVQRIFDWSTAGRGRPELTGTGFLLEFAELAGTRKTTSDLRRVRQEVTKRHVCQVGLNGIAYKAGGAAFVFHNV